MFRRIGLIVCVFVLGMAAVASAQPTTRWKAVGVPKEALDHLNALNGAGIAEFIYNSSGGFVVITHDRRSVERNVPAVVAEDVERIKKSGAQIRTIAFTPNSKGWCIVSDRELRWGGELPPGFVNKLQEFHNKGESVLTVALAPNNGWLVVADREWSEANLPQKSVEDIREFINGGAPNVVAFTPGGGFVLAAGKRYLVRGIPEACFVEIERNSVDGFVSDSIVFGPNESWAVVARKE